ncbi:MAG: GGDEF domain-containing protein, partial [Planctomycetes bacterium]|nr:GGDEF domain-containing protein [Planctomycetota bacterium]
MKGLRLGGLDYLSLPPVESELLARLSLALRLKQLSDRLRNPAGLDHLTGLLNRTAFEEEFQRECNRSRRYDSLFGLVVLDIDGFRGINERCGLGFGDHVLKEVADILRRQTRESDHVARWWGNEFIILLPEADLPKAIGFAKKLHAAVAEHRFSRRGAEVRIHTSIGLTSRQNIGGRDPVEMLKIAQDSVQTAKRAGGNRIIYYTYGEFSQVTT